MEQRYADGGYLARNPDWHAADSPLKAAWVCDLLSRNAVKPASIAEIGCGAGEILLELHKAYPQAELSGFEVSPQAFELCSPKQTEKVAFFFEDLLTSARPRFDLLLAIDVLEHVPDYIGFIRALRDRADYKLFHIPLDLSVQGLMRPSALAQARATIGHLHYFTKETAIATLRDCGLQVIDWRYTHGGLDLPNRTRRTRLLNLPRRLLGAIDQDLAVRWLGGASIMVLTR